MKVPRNIPCLNTPIKVSVALISLLRIHVAEPLTFARSEAGKTNEHKLLLGVRWGARGMGAGILPSPWKLV